MHDRNQPLCAQTLDFREAIRALPEKRTLRRSDAGPRLPSRRAKRM